MPAQASVQTVFRPNPVLTISCRSYLPYPTTVPTHGTFVGLSLAQVLGEISGMADRTSV